MTEVHDCLYCSILDIVTLIGPIFIFFCTGSHVITHFAMTCWTNYRTFQNDGFLRTKWWY